MTDTENKGTKLLLIWLGFMVFIFIANTDPVDQPGVADYDH